MARQKFNFEKRQKELAKGKKQEQKRLAKQARKDGPPAPASAAPSPGTNDAPEST